MSWKVEVIADNSGEWTGNTVRLGTEEEATDYACDLSISWRAVRKWRTVECDDAVTHRWIEGRGLTDYEPPDGGGWEGGFAANH